MKKLGLAILAGVVLVVAAGSFAVQAADPMVTPQPTPAIQPSFTDGRINAYDPGAPVAVFETRKTVPIINDNGVPTTADVVNGVQLLFWDGATAKEVLNVSADQINAAISSLTGKKSTSATNSSSSATTNLNNVNTTGTAVPTAVAGATSTTKTNTNKFTTINNGNAIVISKQNGYSLNYSKDGYLWITTPADYEGKVYTFSWQKNF